MAEFGTSSAIRGWVRVRVLGYGFGVRGRKVKSRDCALASDLVRALQKMSDRTVILIHFRLFIKTVDSLPITHPISLLLDGQHTDLKDSHSTPKFWVLVNLIYRSIAMTKSSAYALCARAIA